ncbi:MAG: hypothetical protein Q8K45_15790 [Rubrivivax sp.]|nr:hypothetical protein [Rubrivivax sp.]
MTGSGYSLGDFTADQADEHVVLHARVSNSGVLTQADGSPLPAMKPGAFVQLRLRATSLSDKEQRAALSKVEVRELLPRDFTLLAIVDTRALEDRELGSRLEQAGLLDVLRQARHEAQRERGFRPSDPEFAHLRDEGPKAHEGLLEVRLLEPLMVERKGLKTFRLQPCPCVVPALRRPPGEPDHDYSLNHALTRISEELELHRISHTGNVFTRYLVPEPAGAGFILRRLGTLRDQLLG